MGCQHTPVMVAAGRHDRLPARLALKLACDCGGCPGGQDLSSVWLARRPGQDYCRCRDAQGRSSVWVAVMPGCKCCGGLAGVRGWAPEVKAVLEAVLVRTTCWVGQSKFGGTLVLAEMPCWVGLGGGCFGGVSPGGWVKPGLTQLDGLHPAFLDVSSANFHSQTLRGLIFLVQVPWAGSLTWASDSSLLSGDLQGCDIPLCMGHHTTGLSSNYTTSLPGPTHLDIAFSLYP